MTEKELVERLILQDATAFRLFVEMYQDKIVSTCFSYLRRREDAEDLAQEVFVQVFKSIDSFRFNSSLSTWVYKICVRKCLDQIRMNKRKKRFGSVNSIVNVTEYQHILKSPADDPHTRLEQIENLSLLFTAIESLTDKKRTALILSKIENLQHDEIARIMECSTSAVATLIHRARKDLKSILHDLIREK